MKAVAEFETAVKTIGVCVLCSTFFSFPCFCSVQLKISFFYHNIHKTRNLIFYVVNKKKLPLNALLIHCEFNNDRRSCPASLQHNGLDPTGVRKVMDSTWGFISPMLLNYYL